MDEAQFTNLLTQLSAWQQHNDQEQNRRENASVLRSTRRRLVVDHTSRIQKCEGAPPSEMREWLCEMDAAALNCQQHPDLLLEIAVNTSCGALRKEVERLIHGNNGIQWAALRTALRPTFLTPNEDEALRREVELVKQRNTETAASYVRRFREAVEKGYPPPRNQDQERIVIRHFFKGLNSSSLVQWLLDPDRQPATLDQAVTLVNRYEDSRERYMQLDRQEEVMEVGAVGHRTTNPVPAKSQDDQPVTYSQMERLITRIAKLEASRSPQATQRRGTQPPKGKWTEDGKPLCNHCGKVGHIKRECRSLRAGNGSKGNSGSSYKDRKPRRQ